jgi:alkylated DNA repair dioxygenase AlkB
VIGVLPEGFALHREWAPHYRVEKLVAALPWEQHTVTVFGKSHPTPRLTAWFGEAGYAYTGAAHPPAEMPPLLDALRARLERHTGARFNSVLANYYRGGSDSVAWHADDEPELEREPVIASLSVGALRRFSVKARSGWPVVQGPRYDVWLGQGDLLVMSGRSQLDYFHSVPKTSREVGPRVNLTFRWVT